MKINDIRENFHSFNMLRRSIIDKRFNYSGIYFGQPPILEYLNENDGATQREIADFLNISAASVAVSVKRMEKSGLLMRVCDSHDARRNNLKLTDEGRRRLQFAHSTFEEIDEITFKGFSTEELNALGSFLCRMSENLQKSISECEKEDKNA